MAWKTIRIPAIPNLPGRMKLEKGALCFQRFLLRLRTNRVGYASHLHEHDGTEPNKISVANHGGELSREASFAISQHVLASCFRVPSSCALAGLELQLGI